MRNNVEFDVKHQAVQHRADGRLDSTCEWDGCRCKYQRAYYWRLNNEYGLLSIKAYYE